MMTLQEAMQSMARDAALNPGQGGKYRVHKEQDGYDLIWKDRSGRSWRIDHDYSRHLWGLPARDQGTEPESSVLVAESKPRHRAPWRSGKQR